MKRSSPAVVAGWGVVAAIGAFVLQTGLALAGLTRIQLPWTLSISLVVIAAAAVILAVPVWRASHGRSERPIDPFAATRTVLFAKAAAVLGAILSGVAVGFAADLLLRPVLAGGDVLARCLVALGASVLLLIAGLVAERLCMVPPGRDPDDEDPAAPAQPG